MNETLHPFQRLQQELAILIAETPAGERLLSEPELANKLGVSRATLREAMRTFEGQGLIRRRQGVGTFVVGHSQVLDSGLEVLESIESMAGRIGLDVSMGTLRIQQFAAEKAHAKLFQLPVSAEMVTVSRVILAESRPVAFLVDELPAEVLTNEELQNGFTGSVLDLLLSRGDLQLAASVAAIQAVAASSEIARAMQIQRGDVLLMMSSKLYDAGERVIDISTSYFLPGYFRFHVVRRVEGTKS
ncbi:MAG TPA: GntR family transcriptional regulator [Anaerolineaceae bacterium]|nr:GntR family transcriptional regulator [Anaerolineaceae bacterium]